MKEYALKSSLYFISKEEELFVKKVSDVLNCNLKFIEEDEDGDKHWSGYNLGLSFHFCRFKTGKLKDVFSLNVRPILKLFDDDPELIIDSHFIKLFNINGVENIMTNDEMRKYILNK